KSPTAGYKTLFQYAAREVYAPNRLRAKTNERAWKILQQGFSIDNTQRPNTAMELINQLKKAEQKPQRNLLNESPLVDGWSAKKIQQWQQDIAQALKKPVVFQDSLQDGSLAPKMVIIPNGKFTMGSPKDEPDREPWDTGNETQHRVTINAFAIAQYAVTFEEYAVYCQHLDKEMPDDEDWGKGKRPVINISWQDAADYAMWLSRKTGKSYRLPSEAEWEYACRAGTKTSFSFGETINSDQANFNFNKGKTQPVGSYPANAYGLHDMLGNVWEWVQDKYQADYKKLPNDGSAWEFNTGARRVIRGGSWNGTPRYLRSAYRYGSTPDNRDYDLGFRLARSKDK
ncbi:MAG TPA: formylglycine-generating enzyme family protein, partial [Leucothrix mucor]|nr:formylglycine-generating enzyme family protein [Leucothrix mucor]